MAKKSNISVEEYLKNFPADIREISNGLRDLIKEIIPNNIEAVYTGWKLIGFRAVEGKKSYYFCFIAPFNDKVKLGFEYGNLMGKSRLLISGGSQIKYVEIKNIKEIDEEKIGRFISKASVLAVEKHI